MPHDFPCSYCYKHYCKEVVEELKEAGVKVSLIMPTFVGQLVSIYNFFLPDQEKVKMNSFSLAEDKTFKMVFLDQLRITKKRPAEAPPQNPHPMTIKIPKVEQTSEVAMIRNSSELREANIRPPSIPLIDTRPTMMPVGELRSSGPMSTIPNQQPPPLSSFPTAHPLQEVHNPIPPTIGNNTQIVDVTQQQVAEDLAPPPMEDNVTRIDLAGTDPTVHALPFWCGVLAWKQGASQGTIKTTRYNIVIRFNARYDSSGWPNELTINGVCKIDDRIETTIKNTTPKFLISHQGEDNAKFQSLLEQLQNNKLVAVVDLPTQSMLIAADKKKLGGVITHKMSLKPKVQNGPGAPQTNQQPNLQPNMQSNIQAPFGVPPFNNKLPVNQSAFPVQGRMGVGIGQNTMFTGMNTNPQFQMSGSTNPIQINTQNVAGRQAVDFTNFQGGQNFQNK